ncbi:DUF4843 domain-containing protein [uncultured Chitinophaga sp.]|uniref:DUF4843 domain-containing protein n=1 Tax=uncultured Chitinophaga sp. TaxID=339340 RepID=UPI0025D79514|nr:DUF4843 domain-containing protein [uncultured Chitinophaga sp.]
MKKLVLYIAVLMVTAIGCKKAEQLVYNDIARIQLHDTAAMNFTFVYDAATVVKDTVYVRVNTIGGITSADRPVKFVQVPEYDYTYVRDPITNQIIDTVETERPFKAVPGIHYLDFNDKAAPPMVVSADSARAFVPVVLLRDPSLKENTYRLRIQIAANDAFGLGEIMAREMTIIFSDRLERFYSWRTDNTVSPAFNNFGKYSTGKHQFMIDALKTNINEEWYQAALTAGAMQQYRNVVKQLLTEFNANPANIASGKAPLRETDNPTSAVVTFP